MRQGQRHWPQWVAAAVPAAVIAVYALFCTHPHYDLSDDVLLMRSFGGMVGGVCEQFNYITHTFLGWALGGLSALWPGAAWFTVFQLAVLAGAACGIVRYAMRCAQGLGLAAWCGWLAGTVFLAALVAEHATSVTYTLTAAVAGSAAIWALLAVDWTVGRRRAARGVFLSALWLFAAYLLREAAFLPSLAVWLGALATALLVQKAPWRGVLAGALAAAALFGAAAGVRAVQLSAPENAAYLAWQEARTQAMDYGGLAAADEAAIAQAGWTPQMAELVLSGCLLDERVTTQALSLMQPPQDERSPEGAAQNLRILFRRSRTAYWACAAAMGMCAVAALLTLLAGRGDRLWPLLAAVGCGLGTAGLLFYLAWMGRLPARAAMTVLLPANAMAMWLLLHSAARLWREGCGLKRCAALCALLLSAALLFPCARAAWRNTYNPSRAQGEAACTRLERYALAHGDELFIADGAFGEDRALFPDWSAGKPANLLLGWGGWNNHSEGYRAAFARFGYAHDGFEIADFVNSPLRLVTAESAAPTEAFMACLREQTGQEIIAEAAEENGFWVYRFTTADKGEIEP